MPQAVACFILLALAWQRPSPFSGPLTVSAAVSLTEAMEEVAKEYEASGADRVVFNFGGSNMLARQIVNGAPVDVFISADAWQMDVVERAQMVAPGTRVSLLSNQLAIVGRAERAEGLTSAASLAGAAVRRIAVGDPEAVPAGVYAKQYLERVGLWRTLQAKLLPAANVRAALAAVENGSADAGIVYVSDVRAARGVRVASVVSGPDAPSIVYPACVVAGSRRRDAGVSFLKFLQTPAASRVFQRHGFQPLASRP
jgi:molybdate transport system substrate-binding protein